MIPGFGENGKDAVTVEQLLVHQSGFPTAPLDLAADPDPRASGSSATARGA